MDIQISPELASLLRRLGHCHDPRTGERVFTGLIRVAYDDTGAQLLVEDTIWETTDGSAQMNTAMLRDTEEYQ